MYTVPSLCFSVALLFISAAAVSAADDNGKDNTDFLMNIFSDIGPILALFGEQFARQFLSETFTWEDHVIFACIPLGIITAISGAIRVQGGGLFKAIIGRARENHASAEIEYMSSTSTEVCELYNGEGIVRTMGKPHIGQIIVCPDQLPKGTESGENGDSCGIHTLETAKKDGLMEYQDYQAKRRYPLLKWLNALLTPKDVNPNPPRQVTRISTDLETGTSQRQSPVDLDSHGPHQEASAEHGIPLEELPMTSSRRELPQTTLPNGRNSSGRQDSSLKLTQTGQRSEKKNPWLTLRSPNLQLNIPCEDVSEKKHHYHLVLAAFFASILQLSLLVIAISTVYFISGFEPEPWGLPCYLIGSILLFLGMLACSVAIEKRTRELTWYIPAAESQQERKKFHLLWVQRNQRVSEQDFGSYIIDGGSRRHVMTSSRVEDLEGLETLDQPVHEPTTVETATTNTTSRQEDGDKGPKLSLLLLLPLIAVSFGGVGFTVQFIGLRGLPWPCAVSQLGAMIIMVIIRALIRSRLTNTFNYHDVLEKHELDHLAIQLVEKNGNIFDHDPVEKPTSAKQWDIRTKFRSGLNKMVRNRRSHEQRPSTEILVWKVDTACDVIFEPKEIKEGPYAQSTDTDVELVFKPRSSTSNTDPPLSNTSTHGTTTFHTSEGQRAILVRKRLGDLCKWPNSTSKSALALTLSIEKFMKEFFPEGLPTDDSDKLKLRIPFIRSQTSDQNSSRSCPDQTDVSYINLDMKRYSNSKEWNVDNGQVEAILSLWMAHWMACRALQIETEGQEDGEKGQTADWRRTADGSQVDYCRRIGQNRNQVLERDISWWISNTVGGLQSEPPESREELHDDNSSGKKESRFVFGFNLLNLAGSSKTPDSSQLSDSDEIYESFKPSDFLVQHSTADLVTVMAQHLFTCFIWNIGGLLPRNIFNREDLNLNEFVKVESSRLFDGPSSARVQSVRKLSHRRLTEFVNYAEKQGLGTSEDILLCIIPAFSLLDCLPNNAILDYDQLVLKRFAITNLGEQKERCIHYINLLHSVRDSTVIQRGEYISLVAVANTMEFVYLMALHIAKTKVCGISQQTHPKEFIILLESLLGFFGDTLYQLSPFYELQRRRETLKCLFNDLEISTENDDIWSLDWKEQGKNKTFMHSIGFTSRHRRVVGLPTGHQLNLLNLFVMAKNSMERDIFGWTPLHYAAARPNLNFGLEEQNPQLGPVDRWLDTTLNDNLQTNRWVDKFRRSPVHIAAANGNINLLRILLPYLHDEARFAICRGGIDEMSPLHLAAQGNHKNCEIDMDTQQEDAEGNCNESIVALLEHMGQVQNDAWQQSPIQTALTKRCYRCTLLLLQSKKLNFNPETPDEFGKPLLSYLNKDDKQHCLIGRELILKHYKKFDVRKSGSDNILHHAVRLLNGDDFRSLLEVLRSSVSSFLGVDVINKHGQTPLHLAVAAGKPSLVTCLIKAGASPSVQDKDGKTALHHAASSNLWSNDDDLLDVVGRLSKVMISIDVCDHNDETPLSSALVANRTSVCLVLLRNKASIKMLDIRRLSTLNNIIQSSAKTERLQEMWQIEIWDATAKHANEQDMNGDTALHTAVHQQDYDTIDWLMQNDVDLRMENDSGRTAFIEACRRSNCHNFIRHVVHALNSIVAEPKSSQTPHLEGGTDIEQDPSGTDWLRSLVRTKFDINAGDSMYDKSPLAWACEDGLENVVQILLEAKYIDVKRKATKYDNYTPLHFALASKNYTIVQLLLDHSEGHVIWSEPDETGFTTIQFAIKFSNGDCLYKLLMHPKGRRGELSYSDPGAVLKVCVGYNIQPSDWDWISGRIALDETVEQNFVDADKWTLADIAGKYGHPNLQRHLRNKMEKSMCDS